MSHQDTKTISGIETRWAGLNITGSMDIEVTIYDAKHDDIDYTAHKVTECDLFIVSSNGDRVPLATEFSAMPEGLCRHLERLYIGPTIADIVNENTPRELEYYTRRPS